MAVDKRSFVAYTDWNEIFKKLTDDEAGKLSKMLFSFVSDENPTAPDRITELLFEPMKQHLKRDLRKYEATKQKRAEAGRSGGLKSGKCRSEALQNIANASNDKQKEANASNDKQKEANASNDKQKEANASKTQANEAGNGNGNGNGNVNGSSSVSLPPPPRPIDKIEAIAEIVTTPEDGREKLLYEMFCRTCSGYEKDFLKLQAKKFLNKYPNCVAAQSGGLVNAWSANLNKEEQKKWIENSRPIVDNPKKDNPRMKLINS